MFYVVSDEILQNLIFLYLKIIYLRKTMHILLLIHYLKYVASTTQYVVLSPGQNRKHTAAEILCFL